MQSGGSPQNRQGRTGQQKLSRFTPSYPAQGGSTSAGQDGQVPQALAVRSIAGHEHGAFHRLVSSNTLIWPAIAHSPSVSRRTARSAGEARGPSPSQRAETPTLVVECAALDWRGADADIAPDRASRAEQVGSNRGRIGAKLSWNGRPKVGPPYIRLCILLDRGLRSESRCIPP